MVRVFPIQRIEKGKECMGFIVSFCFLFLPLIRAFPVLADEADDYIEKGKALYRTYHLVTGRYDEAIAAYEKALALRPEDYGILWRLSEMHESYGETLGDNEKPLKIHMWSKGTEYGRRAVEVNPEGKEGHFFYMANMGALARIQGTWMSILKFRRVKREMDKTLELDPNYPPVLVARAQYLTELPWIFGGDEEEAVRLYYRVLELDPGFIVAHYYLAEIDVKHGRYQEALEKLDKAANCKRPWNPGHAEKIVRPWSERLRKRIRQETEKK